MGLRKVLSRKDEMLRKKCRPVTDFGGKISDLMDDLRETMVASHGAGLAAPQVGILRRAVVIVRGDEIIELINPEILERSEDKVGEFEGCLSCPNQRAWIMRPRVVKVRAQDRSGKWFELECEEFAARAACHELDHLDGVLFTDFADKVFTESELDEMLSEQEEDDE
ncbi:MAG: peptide deformylase [Oscillospiraceae bacterium]